MVAVIVLCSVYAAAPFVQSNALEAQLRLSATAPGATVAQPQTLVASVRPHANPITQALHSVCVSQLATGAL